MGLSQHVRLREVRRSKIAPTGLKDIVSIHAPKACITGEAYIISEATSRSRKGMHHLFMSAPTAYLFVFILYCGTSPPPANCRTTSNSRKILVYSAQKRYKTFQGLIEEVIYLWYTNYK